MLSLSAAAIQGIPWIAQIKIIVKISGNKWVLARCGLFPVLLYTEEMSVPEIGAKMIALICHLSHVFVMIPTPNTS